MCNFIYNVFHLFYGETVYIVYKLLILDGEPSFIIIIIIIIIIITILYVNICTPQLLGSVYGVACFLCGLVAVLIRCGRM